MSAQFKQNQSTHHVIAIPRVFWLNNFIVAGLGFLPPEPVVFDVIDGFKEYATDECGQPKGEGSPAAKDEIDGNNHQQLGYLKAQHFVAQ